MSDELTKKQKEELQQLVHEDMKNNFDKFYNEYLTLNIDFSNDINNNNKINQFY